MADHIDLLLADVGPALESDRQRLVVSAGDVEVFVEFSRRDAIRARVGLARIQAALVEFVRSASEDSP